VNIWQSYKQQRGCLVHFARLTDKLIQDEASDGQRSKRLEHYCRIISAAQFVMQRLLGGAVLRRCGQLRCLATESKRQVPGAALG